LDEWIFYAASGGNGLNDPVTPACKTIKIPLLSSVSYVPFEHSICFFTVKVMQGKL
jgi:hypothetical protein